MKTKLILVEGLPSSGKSTTARIVKEILNTYNIDTELFCEGNLEHPADYDGVAFFHRKKFNQLIKSFKNYKEKIYQITIENENGYLVYYKKGTQKLQFPEKLCKEFYKNDIYELPLEIHMKLLKERWLDFKQKAKKENKLYVFECVFIQNPLTVTMIRDNKDKETIINYIKELESIIAELNPVILYIRKKSIENSFKTVICERPKEWLDFFIDYYTKQGYGQSLGLIGLEGVIKILKDRENIEYKILNELSSEIHIIDNLEHNLEDYKQKIKNVIQQLV